MKPPPSIHLHIEQLVIDGLPLSAAEAGVLQAGITEELHRLFTEELDAGSISGQHLRALPQATAEIASDDHVAFGHGVASTVHQSLTPVLGGPARAIPR